MGGHVCVEQDFTCGVCGKFLIRANCCYYSWTIHPFSIKEFVRVFFCNDCFSNLKCRKCNVSFKEVFQEEGSKYYTYYSTISDYTTFFKLQIEEIRALQNEEKIQKEKFIDCNDCIGKEESTKFFLSCNFPRFEQPRTPLQSPSFERNRSNFFLSLPNDILKYIFSFLTYPKNFSRICLISKHIQEMIYFSNDFFWVKALRIRARKILSKFKGFISPDFFVLEMLRRFMRFPGFTGFDGLEYFDFKGVSEKVCLIFFDFLKNNHSKLRQTIPMDGMMNGYTGGGDDKHVFSLFKLFSEKRVDFRYLTKCTITEDYIPILLAERKVYNNLRKLVLLDDVRKREMLYGNDQLFHTQPLEKAKAPSVQPDPVSISTYKSLTHKVDWSKYCFNSKTLNLNLSMFPRLEKLITYNSRLRICNFSSTLRDFRFIKSIIMFPEVSALSMKRFELRDSAIVDPKNDSSFDYAGFATYSNLCSSEEETESLLLELISSSGSLERFSSSLPISSHNLIEKCPKLKVLDLTRAMKYQDFLNYLQFLELEEVKYFNFSTKETPESLSPDDIPLLKSSKSLKRCRICYRGEDHLFVFNILSQLSNLEFLSIQHNFSYHELGASQTGVETIFNGSSFIETLEKMKGLTSLSIAKSKLYKEIPLEFTRRLSQTEHFNLKVLLISNQKDLKDKEGTSLLWIAHLENILKIRSLEELHTSYDLSDKVFKSQKIQKSDMKKWFLESKEKSSLKLFTYTTDGGNDLDKFFCNECDNIKKLFVGGYFETLSIFLKDDNGRYREIKDVKMNFGFF